MFDEKFWVAVCFFILVASLYRPLKAFITRALDERSDGIKRELDEAIRLKDEAEALLTVYQRKQKEAMEDAQNILAHAEEEVARITEEAHAELEASLNKRMELCMQKIASYEAHVLTDVRNKAIDAAIDAARDILQKTIDAPSAATLIENAVSDIKVKLH